MRKFQEFVNSEASGGIILITASILALLAANLPFSAHAYEHLLHIPVTFNIAGFGFDLGFSHFVNDVLMALFFLAVAIEIKHELSHGHLSSLRQASFPLIGAIGGVLFPALIYLIFNHNIPVINKGWAIPTATDIAFALGVLSLLGKRVPTSIKVFLLALAVIDDLMAIIIIALFYTHDLSVTWLAFGLAAIAVMYIMNRSNMRNMTPYIIIFVIAWFAFYRSGIHATIAGVLAGFMIPNRSIRGRNLAADLEAYLSGYIKWLIIPIFAFVNAGVSLAGIGQGISEHFTLMLGILLGLLIGKPVGIFFFTYIATKLKLTHKPETMHWDTTFFVGIICGIGFTMSIFITNLSFPGVTQQQVQLVAISRLSILITSILAAVIGLVFTGCSLIRHEKIQAIKKAQKRKEHAMKKQQRKAAMQQSL